MSLSTLIDISNYLQWSGSIIIFLCWLPLFNKRKPHVKFLLFYSLASIGFQLAQQVSILLLKYQMINQIGNGFVFFEMVLLGLIFVSATKEPSFRKVIEVIIVFYILYYCIILIFFNTNSYSLIRAGRDLLLILSAIIYFSFVLTKMPENNLIKFPMFWIAAVVLFFFSGTFFLSFLIDYMDEVLKEDTRAFWAFRNFFRFGFCLVLAYAGWLDLQQLRSEQVKNRR
jgi:hypothetical protein